MNFIFNFISPHHWLQKSNCCSFGNTLNLFDVNIVVFVTQFNYEPHCNKNIIYIKLQDTVTIFIFKNFIL